MIIMFVMLHECLLYTRTRLDPRAQDDRIETRQVPCQSHGRIGRKV